MEKISCRILDSVTKINKQDWDSLFGSGPEGYSFYQTIEESGLEEFVFHYLVLLRAGKVAAIAPLFITDFNLDIACEGCLKDIIGVIRKLIPRFLMLKTMFCGSPFRENGALGIRADTVEEKASLIKELIERMRAFSREKSIPLIIFKDFLKEGLAGLDVFEAQGFFRVGSFPSVAAELNFSSFNEYLNSLSYSTRKSLRRKLKKANSQNNIQVKVVERVDDIIQDVHRLYVNTYHNGTTKFERLTPQFFINAARNLTPHAKFFLYYVDGKLSAFNLCLIYKDLFIDKFIGFDYDIARRYALYFLSWCFNVEWCLKNSIRVYQTGQTDYYPKLKLGGKLIPLYVYLRHRNALANLLIRLLARVLKPDNFDTDIKGKVDV